MRHATVEELRGVLASTAALRASGLADAGIARDVAAGILHRVRRGWYMDAATWDELWPESRHRAHVLAAAQDIRGARVVFCLTSAAVLLELPLYRLVPASVHVMLGGTARHNASDLRRHEGSLPESDIVEIDGMLCTSVERTVFDLARLATAEAGIAAADAALAQVGGDPRRYDTSRADEWLNLMRRRATVPGARGIRQARMVLDVADGRARSTLEAVSTLQLHRMQFPRPRLQVPVPAPQRGHYWMDVEFTGLGVFGECDGESKYLEEALRSGRTLEQVLLDEKQREDWVRGTTGHRVVRWGDRVAATAKGLAVHLAQRGIAIPRMPR